MNQNFKPYYGPAFLFSRKTYVRKKIGIPKRPQKDYLVDKQIEVTDHINCSELKSETQFLNFTICSDLKSET